MLFSIDTPPPGAGEIQLTVNNTILVQMYPRNNTPNFEGFDLVLSLPSTPQNELQKKRVNVSQLEVSFV